MNIKEYNSRRDELNRQMRELDDEYIKNNEFSHLMERKVRIKGMQEVVIFCGLRMSYSSLEIAYRKIKKNGEPHILRNFAYLYSDTTITPIEEEL